jgi:NAD(P) transhydrogenase subunit beta
MQAVINLAYLASAVLFIFGLKRQQSPATARTGNVLSSLGMLVAVVATLFLYDILDPWMIVGGLVLAVASALCWLGRWK